ncbi:MAG: glycosyltransferase [bacterium]
MTVEHTIIIPLTTNLCNLRETIKSVNEYSEDHEILVIVDDRQKVESEIVKTMASVVCKKSTIGEALNACIDSANGKYITILKDNALVSPNWLNKLKRTFLLPSYRPVTIAAPILSHTVFSVQQCEFSLTSGNYIKALEERKFNYGYTLANLVSDVCIMFERTNGVRFNGTLNSGEIFDVVVRNTLSGNICAINKGVFIFDKSPITKLDNLSKSIIAVAKIHNRYLTRPQTILGVIRTKITNDFDAEIFKMVLDKTKSLVDKILVLNEGQEYPFDLIGDINKLDVSESIHNEKASEAIIDRIEELNCDWILHLNEKEVLEESITRKDLDRLIYNPNPLIHGYVFQDYLFEGTDNNYTASQDSTKTVVPNLFRYIPNSKHRNFAMLLKMTEDSLCVSSMRYKQYIEPAKNKPVFTTKMWNANNRIDICTIMKNEEAKLFWYMHRHFGFANNVILIDTGSTDSSIELARLLGAIVYEERDGSKDFARARNTYLNKSSSEWIFHVDLDEYCSDLTGIRKLTEGTCDNWLFKIQNRRKDGSTPTSETIRLFRNKEGLSYKGIIHEILDTPKPPAYSPIILINEGFLEDDDVVARKVKMYLDMCMMRIKQDPEDVQALYSVGIHLADDNRYELAIAMLNKAVRLMSEWHLPKKELAVTYLHFGKQLYKELVDMLPAHHPDRLEYVKVFEFLNNAFKPRIIDVVSITKDISDEDIMKIL